MTSAVGPADVSVDRSTLTGQRSTVKGHRVHGQRARGPTGQPQPEADRRAPRVRWQIKEKSRFGFWAERGNGPAWLAQKARLGS
jgi:hypothetical protein